MLLFHAAALWALQAGLVARGIEVVVPVEMLSQLIELPKPKEPLPAPLPPPKAPPPTSQPVVKRTAPTLPPPPMPLAVADPLPAPNAPTGVTTPQPTPPPIAAPVAAAPSPPVPPLPPPVPAKVELPSSDADYLQNPSPAYPAVSRRLNEQGKVLVRVLIGVDGAAKDAEIRQGSGYDRLDKAALETVKRWRYVPGKRGGVAEAMWFTVPINFVLE